MAHDTWEAAAGGSLDPRVRGQPGQDKDTLSPENKTKVPISRLSLLPDCSDSQVLQLLVEGCFILPLRGQTDGRMRSVELWPMKLA